MSEHAPVCDHPLFTYQPAWAHGEHGALVGHATHNAHLPVTPAALWTVLSDPRTWSDWLTVHQRWVTQPRAQFVPGARMTAETLMLGIAATVEWTVDSAMAPGTLVLIGTGEAGLRTRLTFLITPADDGSRLTVTSEIAGELLTEPVVAVIERDGAEQLAHSVQMLLVAASEPSAVRRPTLRLVHSAPDTVSAAPSSVRRLRAVR
ncbi:type II toxin-antitoxin system Rv0910 family toxin [Mycobacterium sp. NPDC003323]